MSQVNKDILKFDGGGPTSVVAPKTYGTFTRVGGKTETVDDNWLSQYSQFTNTLNDSERLHLSNVRNALLRGENVTYDPDTNRVWSDAKGDLTGTIRNPREKARSAGSINKAGRFLERLGIRTERNEYAGAMQRLRDFTVSTPEPEAPKLTELSFGRRDADYNLVNPADKKNTTRQYSKSIGNQTIVDLLRNYNTYATAKDEQGNWVGDKQYKVSGLGDNDKTIRDLIAGQPDYIENLINQMQQHTYKEGDVAEENELWDNLRAFNIYRPGTTPPVITGGGAGTTPAVKGATVTNAAGKQITAPWIKDFAGLSFGGNPLVSLVEGTPTWSYTGGPLIFNEYSGLSRNNPYYGGMVYDGRFYTKAELNDPNDPYNLRIALSPMSAAFKRGTYDDPALAGYYWGNSPWKTYGDTDYLDWFHNRLSKSKNYQYFNLGGDRFAVGTITGNPTYHPVTGAPSMQWTSYTPGSTLSSWNKEDYTSAEDLLSKNTIQQGPERIGTVENIGGQKYGSIYTFSQGANDPTYTIFKKVGDNQTLYVKDSAGRIQRITNLDWLTTLMQRKSTDKIDTADIKKLYSTPLTNAQNEEELIKQGYKKSTFLGDTVWIKDGKKYSMTARGIVPYKDGGVLGQLSLILEEPVRKYQMGGMAPTERKLAGTQVDYLRDVTKTYSAEDKEKANVSGAMANLTEADKLQLGSLLADTGAMGLSVATGNNPITGFVSAGMGLTGTGLQFVADVKRDGLDWGDVGRAAFGLGFDIAGLVPIFGSAAKVGKFAKGLKTAKKTVQLALGGLGVSSAARVAWDKWERKDRGENVNMSLDDYRAIAQGLMGVMSLGRAADSKLARTKKQADVSLTSKQADDSGLTINIKPQDAASINSLKGADKTAKLESVIKKEVLASSDPRAKRIQDLAQDPNVNQQQLWKDVRENDFGLIESNKWFNRKGKGMNVKDFDIKNNNELRDVKDYQKWWQVIRRRAIQRESAWEKGWNPSGPVQQQFTRGNTTLNTTGMRQVVDTRTGQIRYYKGNEEVNPMTLLRQQWWNKVPGSGFDKSSGGKSSDIGNFNRGGFRPETGTQGGTRAPRNAAQTEGFRNERGDIVSGGSTEIQGQLALPLPQYAYRAPGFQGEKSVRTGRKHGYGSTNRKDRERGPNKNLKNTWQRQLDEMLSTLSGEVSPIFRAPQAQPLYVNRPPESVPVLNPPTKFLDWMRLTNAMKTATPTTGVQTQNYSIPTNTRFFDQFFSRWKPQFSQGQQRGVTRRKEGGKILKFLDGNTTSLLVDPYAGLTRYNTDQRGDIQAFPFGNNPTSNSIGWKFLPNENAFVMTEKNRAWKAPSTPVSATNPTTTIVQPTNDLRTEEASKERQATLEAYQSDWIKKNTTPLVSNTLLPMNNSISDALAAMPATTRKDIKKELGVKNLKQYNARLVENDLDPITKMEWKNMGKDTEGTGGENNKRFNLSGLVDAEDMLHVGRLIASVRKNNKMAGVMNEAINKATNAAMPQYVSEIYNSYYGSPEARGLRLQADAVQSNPVIHSDPFLANAFAQSNQQQRNALLNQAVAAEAGAWQNTMLQNTDLARNYAGFRNQTANARGQLTASAIMQKATNKNAAIYGNWQSGENAALQYANRLAGDREIRDNVNAQILSNKAQMDFNKSIANAVQPYKSEFKSWQDNNPTLVATYPTIEDYVQAYHPEKWAVIQQNAMGSGYSSYLKQIGNSRIRTPFYKFQYAKKGAKLLNATDHIWIDSNRATKKAISKLNDHIIDLFKRTLR